MSKITHAIKSLFVRGDRPAARPVRAALIEAVEGRMLMSATLGGAAAPAPATSDATAATVVARKAGGEQQQYLSYTLENVLISSYSIGASNP